MPLGAVLEEAKYSTKQFTFNKKEKLFTANINDLCNDGICFKAFIDKRTSCDGYALDLVSHITNQVSTWYVYNSQYTTERGLVNYQLIPTSETMKKFPSLKGYRIVINR